jgi:hypothetical protein
MKTLLSTTVIAICVACAHAGSAFVQGGIRIVPPVTREGHGDIERLSVFNDGGTQSFKITDAEGKHFDIYIDHRIGSPTPCAIYLYAYPDKPQSVRVLNQRELECKIGVFK